MVREEPALLASPGCHQRKPDDLLKLVTMQQRQGRENSQGRDKHHGAVGQAGRQFGMCLLHTAKLRMEMGLLELKRDRPSWLETSADIFTPLGTSQ